MTISSTWFSRHVSGALITNMLCLGMILECGSIKKNDHHKPQVENVLAANNYSDIKKLKPPFYIWNNWYNYE